MNRLEETMKRVHSIMLPVASITALLITGCQGPPTRIASLSVQSSVEPLAIEDENPLFSWQMVSNTTGQQQTAYRIVVTRGSDGEVAWDNNDTNEARYNKEAADLAWGRTVAFLKKHLGT